MQYVYQQTLNFDKGIGVVFGSFAPLHKGHLDLIYKAKKEQAGGCLIVVCGSDNDKGWPKMTLKERYQMVRQYFQRDPLVAVYALDDTELGIECDSCDSSEWNWGSWLEALVSQVIAENKRDLVPHAEETMSFLKQHITFYTGEETYSRDIEKLGWKTSVLDRELNTLTGTQIRENPILHWDEMAWTYHRKFCHNILITGTASEGKTTLVEDIGRYFNIPYSYEWPKDYVEKFMVGDWELDARDFLTFLVGQYNHNRDMLECQHNSGVFISDTDSIVTKMYAKRYALDPAMALTMQEYESIIAPAADAFIKKSRWDKIFVLVPHGEFVDDHVRYLGHSSIEERIGLFHMMMEEIKNAGLSDKVEFLTGSYLDNFSRVKQYIEETLR